MADAAGTAAPNPAATAATPVTGTSPALPYGGRPAAAAQRSRRMESSHWETVDRLVGRLDEAAALPPASSG
ncbi:hypothetical protein GCM10025734_49460 [Kitasatospora paranensis]|uniref:hypothetical protein n=1 Tax=Kitasatospora paranensis TaxID=258053 RepID=UPI0031EF30DC